MALKINQDHCIDSMNYEISALIKKGIDNIGKKMDRQFWEDRTYVIRVGGVGSGGSTLTLNKLRETKKLLSKQDDIRFVGSPTEIFMTPAQYKERPFMGDSSYPEQERNSFDRCIITAAANGFIVEHRCEKYVFESYPKLQQFLNDLMKPVKIKVKRKTKKKGKKK